MDDFGPEFEGLNAMISAAGMIAQLSRATYLAYIEAGFLPSEAMELTKAVVHEFFALMPSLAQQPPNRQQ